MENSLIDFSKIEITTINDEKKMIDASKAVGNTVYNGTSDIGMMDLARKIYHEGKAEMTSQEIEYFKNILMNSEVITAFLKVALRDVLVSK